MSNIDRIVQTWKSERLPPLGEKSSRSWQELHPKASYQLFDDERLIAWLRENEEKFPYALQHGKPMIRTVDMFRYCQLLEHGGLYADLDFFCLRPMDGILAEHDEAVVLGSVYMPADHVIHSIPNAWMYSKRRGHPFWLVVLDLARRRYEVDWIEYATGPVLLHSAVEIYSGFSDGMSLASWGRVTELAHASGIEIPTELPPVHLLPENYLYPFSWMREEDIDIIDQINRSEGVPDTLAGEIIERLHSYAFTSWSHSWGGNK